MLCTGSCVLNYLFTKGQNFRLLKLKAFADDKINVNQQFKFHMGRLENIAGKGENAGYQYFLLFPQCFQKASFSGSLKVVKSWDCVEKSYEIKSLSALQNSMVPVAHYL